MIRHVVMFTWADSVDAAHIAATASALGELPGKIDAIRSYAFGPDLGLVEGNGDFAVVGDFDDADSYARYAAHPDHVAMIGEYVKGHITSRSAVQFEI